MRPVETISWRMSKLLKEEQGYKERQEQKMRGGREKWAGRLWGTVPVSSQAPPHEEIYGVRGTCPSGAPGSPSPESASKAVQASRRRLCWEVTAPPVRAQALQAVHLPWNVRLVAMHTSSSSRGAQRWGWEEKRLCRRPARLELLAPNSKKPKNFQFEPDLPGL